jgi:hypothetical protein
VGLALGSALIPDEDGVVSDTRAASLAVDLCWAVFEVLNYGGRRTVLDRAILHSAMGLDTIALCIISANAMITNYV